MRMSSVAMKGSSASTWAVIVAGYTTRPSKMFCSSTSRASAVKKASGMTSRLLAESSSVRSSICAPSVIGGEVERLIR